jgi:hypothetical protein
MKATTCGLFVVIIFWLSYGIGLFMGGQIKLNNIIQDGSFKHKEISYVITEYDKLEVPIKERDEK